MTPRGDQIVFFIHIMKTAGWSFRWQMRANYSAQEMFPGPDAEADGMLSYLRIEDLLAIDGARRRQVRAYSGHFPLVAVDLLQRLLERPITTVSLVRDPVERTISYLKHCTRFHEQHRGMPLERVYEDPFVFPCFIHNHQAKVFAMTEADRPESVMDVVEIDDARLDLALRRLDSIDVLGVTEHLDEFLAEVEKKLQWNIAAVDANASDAAPPESFARHVDAVLSELDQPFGWEAGDVAEAGVEQQDWAVSESFRARIAEDNAQDEVLYQHAVRLCRRGEGATSD